MQTKQYSELDGFTSSASFSDCMQYRYTLNRNWPSKAGKRLCFIMLNPSTADEQYNDPTIERCVRRARMSDYGGLLVLNLFAFRSSSPKAMKSAADPVGGHTNDRVLQEALMYCQQGKLEIICGWGTHGNFKGRDKAVLDWFKHYSIQPMALEITKNGHPKHPLYVSYDKQPVLFQGSSS